MRAALVLLAVVFAGCSDPGPASGDEPDDGDPLVQEDGDGGNETLPTMPEPLPPREVFNESFAFPKLPEDEPIEASFEVVDGEEIRLTMASTAECPVYWGMEGPGIVFTSPSGREIALIDFGGSNGDGWSGVCNGASPEYLGIDVQDTYSERGTWGIASSGQFRGSVEIVVILDPAT